MRCRTRRPSLALLQLTLLVAVTCATACSVNPRGEWDALQCNDGLDNDGDGLIDCDDPDCWAFVCKQAPAPKDAGVDASHPVHDAALVEPSDSGSLAIPPVLDEDSGPMSRPDSGTPPPSCTTNEPACPKGTECVDGVCKPIAIAGDYTFTIVSAVVPEQSQTGVCYDFDATCPPLLLSCGICQPDPFVVIYKNGVDRVAETNHRINTRTPDWSDQSFKITLLEGDRLDFAVWDWDPFYNTRIFICTPDLRDLPTGMLQCSPSSSMTIEPGHEGPYKVLARAKKLP
jgi:hypothetical protein